MNRILVTGRNGQVGFELVRGLAGRGQVAAVGRDRMDLSDPDSIRRAVRETGPDLIVNAAAPGIAAFADAFRLRKDRKDG